MSKTKFKYDESGNIIKELRYGSNGSLGQIQENKIEDNGKKLTQTFFGPDNAIQGSMITYFNRDGNIESTEEVNIFFNSRHYTIFEYTFDEQGNWIKCNADCTNRGKFIIERKIEYFNDN